MNWKKSTKIILWVTYLGSVLCMIILSTNLPQEVAIHFNYNNQADLFAAKRTFYNIFILIFTFIFLVFLFSGWIIRKVPNDMLSFPKSDLWLKEIGREKVNDVLLTFVYGIGIITILFLDITFYLVIEANEVNPPVLTSHFWIYLLSYFLIMSLLIARFLLKFLRGAENNNVDS